jgi:hypothetical protein
MIETVGSPAVPSDKQAGGSIFGSLLLRYAVVAVFHHGGFLGFMNV